ncbi:hypothetical protein [Paenibacillus sp. VCA1]
MKDNQKWLWRTFAGAILLAIAWIYHFRRA